MKRYLGFLTWALLVAGCDNQGCDMLTPLAEPFPPGGLVRRSSDGASSLMMA